MRIMSADYKLNSDEKTASEKFKPREVEAKDLLVEKFNGNVAPVTMLPVGEMPSKIIYGYIDPLEGSPVREMGKKMKKSALLGDFAEKDPSQYEEE